MYYGGSIVLDGQVVGSSRVLAHLGSGKWFIFSTSFLALMSIFLLFGICPEYSVMNNFSYLGSLKSCFNLLYNFS